MNAGSREAGSDPRAEYRARREARQRVADEAADVEARLANARLGLALLAAASIWFLSERVPWPAIVVPGLALFAGLMVVHLRARRRLERARRAVEHYERGLARLRGDFADVVPAGDRWLDDAHPYASHLDLFGTGSLFQLLCGARTSSGRETLVRWLLTGAPAVEIAARQEAVAELRPALDLREDLATLEGEVVEALHVEELEAWGTGPPIMPGRGPRILAGGLAAATAAGAVAAFWIGAAPLAWLLVADGAFAWALRRRVGAVIDGAERPVQALRLALDVLERIERERFEAERLTRIEAALGVAGSHEVPPASARLRDLLRRADALEWRENQIFLPLALPLLWGTNGAFAIDRWRMAHGAEIGGCIRAVGELEALLDLARFAWERPETTFPRVETGPPRLEGEALTHPLLPAGTPNDLSLDATRSLLVVTGSNMSGKSTLLRTVGVNVVLARAGAPVHARSLELSELAVGASIRTVDSLMDGASRFYAEIRAIKRAMDVAETDPPGLFLLDELLHGTNSHDRRIGAASIVRGFLERGAIGIVTTHDLALAEIAAELGERAENAHFEFALEDDEVRFDYELRPGVVRSGNALDIMREAGLDI
ncbi:MAG: DNA mismatch repair protein MutS [Gemmatimonadota bacterium]|nr:DNA mismatch repair protein MutS [Gemmatimonadota bacterium]